MEYIGITPLFIYLFHYSFNKYLQTIYPVQGLILELWQVQSPQGIYSPELKAIGSRNSQAMETDFACRGKLEIKKKFFIVKVIKAEIGYQRKSCNLSKYKNMTT